ncbi:MAG: hypothetical protein AB7V16_08485 [Vulcanibacillus sp.]
MERIILVILTSIIWVVAGIVITWHSLVFLWAIISFGVSKNLYIPEPVKITSYSMLAIIAWGFIVFILNLVWIKYNNYHLTKKKKKMNSSKHLAYIEKEIQWVEAMIGKVNSKNLLQEVDRVKESLSVVLYKPAVTTFETISQSQELLNKSILLMRKGQFTNGISCLRLILEDSESSLIIKNIAKIKLSQCLYELGYEDLANGLGEKVV